MEKVRTAIIGCGAISDRYLTNLTTMFSIIEVVACCNRTHAKAVRAAEKYGIRAMTLDEILADDSIEMVVNLTNPPSHYEVSKKCLLAGKHVYTEKVITVELDEARELIEIANARSLYLGAAPDTFLGSAIQTARMAIDMGMIGKITSCSAYVSRDNKIFAEILPFLAEEGAGIGFDVGIYYITALLSILGPVSQVTGMITQDPQREMTHILPRNPGFGEKYRFVPETVMTGCVRFKSGVLGSLHFNSECIFPEKPALIICGSEGILTMADPNCFGGAVTIRAKGSMEELTLPNHFGFNENSRGVGAAEMAWAIRQARPNRCSKEMAYHALELLHGIVLSDREGRLYTMQSSFERPAPLPRGYLDSGYNGSDPEAALALPPQ